MRTVRFTLFGLAFWSMLFLLSAATEAQQSKSRRIGYLTSSSARPSRGDQAFLQGLQDLGYIDGKNIMIEYCYADGKMEQLPKFAADLVNSKVDIIVTSGSPPVIQAAQHATRRYQSLCGERWLTPLRQDLCGV